MRNRIAIVLCLTLAITSGEPSPPAEDQPRLTVDDVYNRLFTPVVTTAPAWEPQYQYGDSSGISYGNQQPQPQPYYYSPYSYPYYGYSQYLYNLIATPAPYPYWYYGYPAAPGAQSYPYYAAPASGAAIPPYPAGWYYGPQNEETEEKQLGEPTRPTQSTASPTIPTPTTTASTTIPTTTTTASTTTPTTTTTASTTTTTTTPVPEVVPTPTAFYGTAPIWNQMSRFQARSPSSSTSSHGSTPHAFSLPIMPSTNQNLPPRRSVSGRMRCTIYPDSDNGNGSGTGSRREGRMRCVIED